MPEDKTTSDYVLRTLEAKDMAIASLTRKNQELMEQLNKASGFGYWLNAIGDNFIPITVILIAASIAVSGIISSFTPACPVSNQIEQPR